MADPEHVARAHAGIAAWNSWYEENAPRVRPDLSGADLRGADLCGFRLIEADLSGADLRGAQLSGAHLDYAKLCEANLDDASLNKTRLFFADLTGATLRAADLSQAHIVGAKLHRSDLSGANLRAAYLEVVETLHAQLSGANLAQAHLKWGRWYWSNLSGADLSGAHFEEVACEGLDLSEADLDSARFEKCELVRCAFYGAKLSQAEVRETRFDRVDLREANASDTLFARCRFRDGQLTGARFAAAQFRECVGLQFDHNAIERVRLGSSQREAWTGLARRYTLPNASAHLLLVGLYFLPVLPRLSGLVDPSPTRQLTNAALTQAETALLAAPGTPPELLAAWAEAVRAALEVQFAEAAAMPAYRVILGLGGYPWEMAIGVLLLGYTALRLVLTWHVTSLRDEARHLGLTPFRELRAAEEFHTETSARVVAGIRAHGAGHLPAYGETPPLVRWWRYHGEAYGWLLLPDRLLRPLFWLVALGTLLVLGRFLFQAVAPS